MVVIPFLQSETHRSTSIFCKVEDAILRLKNGWCSNETPYSIVGRRRNPALSETFLAMYETISESVETGRWGPCCSIEPTGINATDFVLVCLRISELVSSLTIIWIFLFSHVPCPNKPQVFHQDASLLPLIES